MSENINILVCRHFENEIKSVTASEDFKDVSVACVSCMCGESASHLDDLIRAGSQFKNDMPIEVLCGSCFTNIKDSVLELKRFHFHTVDNCFSMVAPVGIVNYYLEKRAYLLTCGWLADWAARITRWGFDRKTAREFFSETSSCLVLLDTGINDQSAQTLKEFAEFLDLPYEILPVGLGFFELFLVKIILQRRIEIKKEKSFLTLKNVQEQLWDYAMAMDLMATLTRMQTESEIIKNIFEMFISLFAPKNINYIAFRDGKPESTISILHSGELIEKPVVDSHASDFNKEYEWDTTGKGFSLRINHGDNILGILEMNDFTFQEYKERYLNLALLIARICGLIIENARTFSKVKMAEEELRIVNDELLRLIVIDGLTQIANRSRFDSYLDLEWKIMIRNRTFISLIMCDIDFFKLYNDTYGHVAGDECLQKIAKAIESSLNRPSDLAARYGGEEFAVILPGTVALGAIHVAERIRSSIQDVNIPHAASAVSQYVSLSLGVACVIPVQNSQPASLIKVADKALYEAKRNGRNRVVFLNFDFQNP